MSDFNQYSGTSKESDDPKLIHFEKISTIFIKYFVKYYMGILNGLEKLAEVGGTDELYENLGRNVGEAIGNFVPSVPEAFALLGKKLSKYSGNRKTAKIITEAFQELRNTDKLRRTLIEAGGDIFFSFQNQLNEIHYDRSFERGLQKMAISATERSISYIEEKERIKIGKIIKIKMENENFTSYCDMITKGVILCKSKNIFIAYWNGEIHTVQYHNVKCKTTDIYQTVKRVDMKIDSKDKSLKFGYRLPFPWELRESKCFRERFNKFNYIFNEDILGKIIKIINEEDPEETTRRIEDKVDTIVDIFQRMNYLEENIEDNFKALNLKITQKNDLDKKSIWFGVRSPIQSFTGRVNALKKLCNAFQHNDTQIVFIVGLGGIGKTELARKYAIQYEKFYSGNVIWIKAETQDIMNESFRRLANDLKISIKEDNDIQAIARDVYRWFSHTNSLFIFDNVDDGERDIIKMLPLYLPPGMKRPHTLITSRYQDWDISEEGTQEIIILDKFNEEEALEFIKKVLLEINIGNEEEMQNLAEELQYFPLALRQATSYIRKINKKLQLSSDDTFGITDYMEEYKQEKTKKKELLNFKIINGDDRYINNVYTTWNITLHKIMENSDALLIIQIMAYLSPDSINLNYLFSHLMNDNQEKLGKAVGVLCQYSMINLKKGISNIHRLVQEVIRLQLDEQGKSIEVLRQALNILGPILNNVNANKIDISHITFLWNYASDYDELIEEFYFKFSYYNMKYTPLHLLSKAGYAESVQKILNNGKLNFKKIINAKNNDNETPLHIACRNNRLDVIKIFKEYDNGTDHKACLIAAFHGHREIVNFLLLNKNDPNLCLLNVELYFILRNGNSDRFNNFIQGLTENELKTIMQRDFKNVNTRFIRKQWTPTYLAAYYGYFEIVQLLIKNKADINYSNLTGYTALHVAAANGHLEILKLLIENGANKNVINKSGRTILHAASKAGQLDIVKYLINNGILDDVNIPDKKGSTPLHTAAFYGKLNIVEFLLGNEIKNKANLNATDKYGTTPILAAMFNCNTKIVDFLLKENDVNIYSTINIAHNGSRKMDFSVLHMAIAYDEVKMVAKLVEKADLNIIQQKLHENEDHKITAIHIAAYFNSSKVIKYFIKKGVKFDNKFTFIKDDSQRKGRKPYQINSPPFYSLSHAINLLCRTEKIIISIL